MMRRIVGVLAIGLLCALGFSGEQILSGQTAQAVGTITGTVTSEKGPEAGVWVIAETSDLPVPFRKIVVTGDGGRFLVPELPRANYRVWVRGYGLVDSARTNATVGQELKLQATTAKTPQEAAKIYSAPYWLSLMEIPAENQFPGTGPEGNGISPDIKTREEFVHAINNCLRCHQIGNEFTRVIPKGAEGEYTSTIDSWDKRVKMGQRNSEMSGLMTDFGRPYGLKMFADWTDRIAKGEVPAEVPARPQGVERNLVLTLWEWGTTVTKIHDIAASDKRKPTVAPNAQIYGTDIARDMLSMLDPVNNRKSELLIPTLEDRHSWEPNYQQSGYSSRLGSLDRFNPTNIHNPMVDGEGRVWYTAQLRPGQLQPSWCREAAENKFAAYFPIARSGRNVSFFDPKTQKFTMLDTCFGTHHLQFGFDANDTLYFSGGGASYSWINTKEFLRTGDARAAQGWCPTVIDTNGDGKITKPWNEAKGTTGSGESAVPAYPNFDPKRDTRVTVGAYGIIVSPTDGTVWGANESHPGRILRLTVGANPPETCIAEVFEVPNERWGATGPNDLRGSKPRGIDVDRNGVIWTALAASSSMASFDRRKCKGPLTGATAHTGQHCAEGWTLHQLPAPAFKGTNVRKTDFYYYNFVDQFNTLGLGNDVPIATGTQSDSIIALLNGKPLMFRVPYPMGAFHPRGMDGRIDNPNGGWKGRGIYSGSGQDTVWHAEDGYKLENGKFVGVQTPMLVKFQVRPNPLAN
jgi:hypothetical protein